MKLRGLVGVKAVQQSDLKSHSFSVDESAETSSRK